MTAAIDLPKLYRYPVNIWVEDALTSEYLRDLWNDPSILCLIGGSTDCIAPAVQDARRNGMENVFGIADRDFGNTNYAKWDDPDVRIFVLPVHEAENYVIDVAALAGSDANTNGRQPADIEHQMHQRATGLLWWMAFRHTLKRIRNLCWDNFIPLPKPSEVNSLQSAVEHIVTLDWYRDFPGYAANIVAPVKIEEWLNVAATDYSADLNNGNWKRTFSGKELLRVARGFIYEPPDRASQTDYDIDVAKSVAKWQVANGAVPAELNDLQGAIVSKI